MVAESSPSPVAMAGHSALEQAELFGEFADSIERQIRSLKEVLAQQRSASHRYHVGAEGERAVAAAVARILVDLGSAEWRILVDRRWPGTRRANLDVIVVGPPGVLVMDSKNWRAPRIEDGSLWNGDVREDDQLEKLRDQCEAVAFTLADVGLMPAAISPYLVLAGRKTPCMSLGGVAVVGDRSLRQELVRLPKRLSNDEVLTLAALLDERCPPAVRVVSPSTLHKKPAAESDSEPAISEHAAELALQLEIDEAAIWEAAYEAASKEPIESWMTWLHPSQAQLVTRSYSGPARVRGAAGTGKTVVALHRARHLARRPGARVLMTSFVRTLPEVHRSLFQRLAPDCDAAVEFLGIHSWAMRLLRSRGITVNIASDDQAKAIFREAWNKAPAHGSLAASRLGEDYWWDEVNSVIKGRGLDNVEAYLQLNRIGRRTPLKEDQRRALWDLYVKYEERLETAKLWDWQDLLLRARQSLEVQPLETPYTSVVVDEVQDLSAAGLRLVHRLVGDAPDGLYLVGDGQQSIYPGGSTLTECGISVTGRATVLNRNYRNRSEVIEAALQVVSGDQFNDLDEDPEPGARAVEVDRPGGWVKRCIGADRDSQYVALVSDLSWTVKNVARLGDVALLVRSNWEAKMWLARLADAGIPAMLLKDYDGNTSGAVKVGTYQRAKGLEFACVFIPDHELAVPPQGPTEADDVYRERAELQRRQMFVAMTRARDRLWLGSTQDRSVTPSSTS